MKLDTLIKNSDGKTIAVTGNNITYIGIGQSGGLVMTLTPRTTQGNDYVWLWADEIIEHYEI